MGVFVDRGDGRVVNPYRRPGPGQGDWYIEDDDRYLLVVGENGKHVDVVVGDPVAGDESLVELRYDGEQVTEGWWKTLCWLMVNCPDDDLRVLNETFGGGGVNGGVVTAVDFQDESELLESEPINVVEAKPETEVNTRLVVKAEDFWPGLSGDNTQRLALKLEGMLRNGGVEWEVAKHNKRTEETVVKLTGRDRSVCVISEKNFRNAIGDQELDLESLLQNMSSRLYVDLDGVDAPVVSRFVRITQEQLNDSTPLSDLMNWLVNQDQKRNSQAPWGSIMVSPDPDTQGIYKMKPANRPRQRDVYFSRSTLLDSMGFKVLNNETGAVSSWISPRGLVIDASMSDERFIEILNELQIVYNDKEFSPQFELVK